MGNHKNKTNMSDNEFIEADYEREHLLDQMYLYEEQRRAEEDWWEQECERMDRERLPAKVVVIVPKKVESKLPTHAKR